MHKMVRFKTISKPDKFVQFSKGPILKYPRLAKNDYSKIGLVWYSDPHCTRQNCRVKVLARYGHLHLNLQSPLFIKCDPTPFSVPVFISS
jgi:hypothetical protein